MFKALARPDVLLITLAAAGVMAITTGGRQSLGLFMSPINTSTGLGITTISLALAVGQFCWGAIQPFAGAAADRWGPKAVLIAGGILLSLGFLLTPWMSSGFGLIVTLGLMSAMGAGAGSFSVLIGAAAQRLPESARGAASGVINAGGSFGQFTFAPLAQKLIQVFGWMHAMWALAAIALLTLPLVQSIAGKRQAGVAAATSTPGQPGHPEAPAVPQQTMRAALAQALRDRSYWLLHAGFFTCGFHVAFLVTHLPGEVNLCGLPASVASTSLAIIGLANIAGSLYAGACVSLYRSKMVLFAMYSSRALLVIFYLMAPKTEWTYYLFAVGLGFTWLATVPPTAALIGKLFGVRYLSTLFGLTLLSHQTGGFLGAYLGGLAIESVGNYDWMWYADIVLAAAAALLNLPIREQRVLRPAAA